ncbi:MAG: PDZ domain-containing protein [Candidatus Aminicenantales bacterium]|jgi:predicted metalloprotease with PDZ domain
MKRQRALLPALFVAVSALAVGASAADAAWTFTVSMARPAEHLFHVALRCEGMKGEMFDFKMPAWMPGFYRILDYESNVSNFRASDGAGRALPWEKVTRSAWRVAAGNAAVVTVEYDVFGNVNFAAQNYLDEKRAFIAPPGMFLYLPGRLGHPVTVVLNLPAGWTKIATGLDSVPGRSRTYAAPDFDTLYDCPILMGNQESLTFEVKGVPHHAALESVPEAVDRARIAADLKKIVEAATGLIGDIPYKHYSFLLIGTGNGGIEHADSAACFFNGKSLAEPKGYLGWLSYIAHEYFHCFNVKRIRPLALGPFDYDAENYTDMLWVSEGLTVYYEDIVLVRAGLMTPAQYLERLAEAMTRFESSPGHRYQAATESSLQTWSGSLMGGDRATTISYYDNGAMLGGMLDLAIRHASGNRKSLDDVMRTLYRTYDREKKRGFSDAEFRAACETAAGTGLDEVFAYASTTRDVDYAKYFGYGGLRVGASFQDAPGTDLGLDTQSVNGALLIAGITPGSPAQSAGLESGDRILELDGAKAATKVLSDLLASKEPGESVKIRISRNGAEREMNIPLGRNAKPVYAVAPLDGPDPLQAAIWKDWMRKAR